MASTHVRGLNDGRLPLQFSRNEGTIVRYLSVEERSLIYGRKVNTADLQPGLKNFERISN